uniref:Calmodulin n=1 Tax=Odontella aurita TaxID=265563 RepID=A0A7S4KAG0_9STRA|mmetsp:Transcript_799/g.2305  ORF Transcript_799/g.2305 Transcript_799/m.2305 type:complete len:545 (+) Transcript_799:142-1776(+)
MRWNTLYSVLPFFLAATINEASAFMNPVSFSRGWKHPSLPNLNAQFADDLDLAEVESHTTVERDPVTNEHTRKQMVYVDEYNCIGCTACAQIASSTFFMEEENGRARVFQQGGDDDATVMEAIETCPVDCIHYVPYDELKSLEIERRDQVINFKARLVGGDGQTSQKISGNSKARCPNCPTRGCDDCPMYLVGEKQPKYDFIGPVSPVETSPMRGRQRRKLERSMKRLISEVDNYSDNMTATDLTTEELSETIFDRIDKDGDGVLKTSELIGAGMDINAVNLLDMNRDGQINKEEFLTALEMIEEDEGEKGLIGTSDTKPNVATESGSTVSSSMAEELDNSLGELQPLERQELRLGGFEPYILISVLTSESSFETIKEYNTDWNTVEDTALDMKTMLNIMGNTELLQESIRTSELLYKIDWIVVGIQLSAAVSAVCGIYATVVFSLCILYGKTALGMDRDEEYYIFMENTGLQRFRAFNAFTFGLFFWVLSLLLVVCQHAPLVFRLPLLGVSVVLLYLGKTEYDVITASAAPMFMPRKWKGRMK